MATKIVTKNSSTASAVPTASDLVQGELAVNVADKRLFTEDNGGAIVEVGTNPSTLTVTGEITANGGIDVTGTATMDGLDVRNTSSPARIKVQRDDNTNSVDSASIDLLEGTGVNADFGVLGSFGYRLEVDGSTNKFNIKSGNGASVANRLSVERDTGDISFYEDTGTTPKLFWDASAESLGIGTSSPEAKLHISTGGGITPFASSQIVSESSGNNYIEINGGSTSTTALYFGDSDDQDVGGVLYSHSNNSMSFRVNAASRMSIDSSGNVGIGTTSPNYELSVHESTANADARIHLTNADTGTGTSDGFQIIMNGANAGRQVNLLNREASSMAFWTSNTERMRIDSSGNLLVGATSNAIGNTGFKFNSTGFARSERSGTGAQGHITFTNGNGDVGSITTSGSSTSYNTSSDYRLKTDAQPMTGATARLKALKPVNFEWIADGTRVDGFLAHEAQEVVPECVSGEKDAMQEQEYEVTPAVLDEEGNTVEEAVMGVRSVPDYQGIDQSKLVPLLVATIQELEARITELENN